jgi:transcriptional regulator with XRE-family HTH domain
MTFGEKVKYQRIKLNMSQSALANELDVNIRTVQNYEADSGYPKSIDIAYKLSKIFNVSTEYLLGETEAFIIDAQAKYGFKGRKDAQELISAFGGLFAGGELNDEDKDKVFKALTDIYWESKEANKKYASNKK